jgi:hypothetical protein
VAAAVLLPARQAGAHATQLSSARAVVSGNQVDVVLELNARDLDAALHSAIAGTGGEVDPTRLAQAREAIASYVTARTRVFNAAGGACRVSPGDLKPKADHVLVHLAWRCPPLAGTLMYEATLFHEIDPAARHMFTASGDVRRMGLLSASTPRVTLATAHVGLRDVLLHYFVAGVEHIAIGYDHIAFLVAVILWGRRLWPLVGAVTAFTVAHSVTLTAAVLDLVTLPAQLVELLIALSIVYVAAENFDRWMVEQGWAAALRNLLGDAQNVEIEEIVNRGAWVPASVPLPLPSGRLG